MSKFLKVLILIVFVAGAVILLNQTLFSISGGFCNCWNEDEATDRCIANCASNGGCMVAIPASSSGYCYHSTTKCKFYTYYKCVDGAHGFFHTTYNNCPDCYYDPYWRKREK